MKNLFKRVADKIRASLKSAVAKIAAQSEPQLEAAARKAMGDQWLLTPSFTKRGPGRCHRQGPGRNARTGGWIFPHSRVAARIASGVDSFFAENRLRDLVIAAQDGASWEPAIQWRQLMPAGGWPRGTRYDAALRLYGAWSG